jgi:hypothetical protein
VPDDLYKPDRRHFLVDDRRLVRRDAELGPGVRLKGRGIQRAGRAHGVSRHWLRHRAAAADASIR